MVALCALACNRSESPGEAPGAQAQAVAGAGVKTGAEGPRSLDDGKHLLLVMKVSRAVFEVVAASVLDRPLPTLRVPEPQPWRLDVLDAEGKVLHSVPLPPASVLRGEFRADAGQMEATRIHGTETAFSARIPLLARASRLSLHAQVHTLPRTDSRTRGKEPEEWIELGQAALPEPTPGETLVPQAPAPKAKAP